MTHPPVDDLPEEATSTLLDVCWQLSQSRHAAWRGGPRRCPTHC